MTAKRTKTARPANRTAEAKAEVDKGIQAIRAAYQLGADILVKAPRRGAFEAEDLQQWGVNALRARRLRYFASTDDGGYKPDELDQFLENCRLQGHVPKLEFLLRLLPLPDRERRKYEQQAIKNGLTKAQLSLLLSAGLDDSAVGHRRKGRRPQELSSKKDLPVRQARIDAAARTLRRLLEKVPDPGTDGQQDSCWPDWLREAKKSLWKPLDEFIAVLAEGISHKRKARAKQPKAGG